MCVSNPRDDRAERNRGYGRVFLVLRTIYHVRHVNIVKNKVCRDVFIFLLICKNIECLNEAVLTGTKKLWLEILMLVLYYTVPVSVICVSTANKKDRNSAFCHLTVCSNNPIAKKSKHNPESTYHYSS